MSRKTVEQVSSLADLSRNTGSAVTKELTRDLEIVTRGKLPEHLWTGKMVGERLIEAVKLCGRIGGRITPAEADAAWPEVFRNHKEVEDMEPVQTVAKTRRDVTAMERAIYWQAKYLAGPKHEAMRRVLALWVRTRLSRKANFNDAVKRRRWSRATAYRVRDRALLVIAIGLMKDGEVP